MHHSATAATNWPFFPSCRSGGAPAHRERPFIIAPSTELIPHDYPHREWHFHSARHPPASRVRPRFMVDIKKQLRFARQGGTCQQNGESKENNVINRVQDLGTFPFCVCTFEITVCWKIKEVNRGSFGRGRAIKLPRIVSNAAMRTLAAYEQIVLMVNLQTIKNERRMYIHGRIWEVVVFLSKSILEILAFVCYI